MIQKAPQDAQLEERQFIALQYRSRAKESRTTLYFIVRPAGARSNG